ncbi:hypothetical protein ABIE86_003069 [Bradyrhizobium diazoefficiens]
MSDQTHIPTGHDLAPGEEEQHSVGERILGYVVGLVLALLLTATSFFIAGTDLVWQPSIPGRADRAGDRADGRAPGVLPAHHHGP